MHREMFNESGGDPQLTHVDFTDDLPEGLTKDTYIEVYSKIWAAIRFNLYKECLEARKELPEGESNLSEETFSKLYEKHLMRFELVRIEIYSKVMGIVADKPLEAKLTMQKAYITFASKPNFLPDGSRGSRPKWPDQIVEAALKHSEYI